MYICSVSGTAMISTSEECPAGKKNITPVIKTHTTDRILPIIFNLLFNTQPGQSPVAAPYAFANIALFPMSRLKTGLLFST
jgi:hypothetical protein